MVRMIAMAGVLLTMGCNGPLPFMSAGTLAGEEQPAPPDWTFAEDFAVVQLETRPEDPYSVNIWGVGIGVDFYVASGKAANTWSENIAADDRVRLRVGKAIYEMRALREDSPEGRKRFLAAAKTKYEFDPDPDEVSDAILYRLVPR